MPEQHRTKGSSWLAALKHVRPDKLTDESHTCSTLGEEETSLEMSCAQHVTILSHEVLDTSLPRTLKSTTQSRMQHPGVVLTQQNPASSGQV